MSAAARADIGDELQLLADALPVLVAYLDASDGEPRYRYVNKIYETWFPYRREEIIGRAVREVVGDKAYAAVAGHIARALAGERLSFEQFMPYADGEARHIKVAYVPRVQDGAVLGIYTLVEDITAAKRAEADLRESVSDYRYAAELNPQVPWTALPDGQLDRVSSRWMEWTGTTGLGATYADALHPDDVDRTFAVWGASVRTGEPYDIVHRVRRLHGEYRWIRSRAYPRRGEDGRILRWYGSTEDIHDEKLAQDHLQLMVLELNHRVKNNLATVQALTVQTLRGSPGAEAAGSALLDRISALATAHDILTRENWDGANLVEVSLGVLNALTDSADRIVRRGPDLRLGARSAISLSMALHELGTNALKYGALSGPSGQVRIEWACDEETGFILTWTESGGPAVTSPSRRGFGTRLLEKGIASELSGSASLAYEPGGLTFRLHAPKSATAV